MSDLYPVFSGPYYQKGFGVPSLFLRTIKYIKPILKRVGIKALKHGLRIGSRVSADMSRGGSVKESIKKHASNELAEILSQKKGGIKKPANKSKFTKRVISTGLKSKKEKDIFD